MKNEGMPACLQKARMKPPHLLRFACVGWVGGVPCQPPSPAQPEPQLQAEEAKNSYMLPQGWMDGWMANRPSLCVRHVWVHHDMIVCEIRTHHIDM